VYFDPVTASFVPRSRLDCYILQQKKEDDNHAKGSAVALCIMWKDNLSINVVDFDKNLIVVKVADQCIEWLLVGFYGPSYHSKKSKAWGNLFALLESYQSLWTCIGDFNFIISDDEQIGGNKGRTSTTNYLKELMFEFNAVDLGYLGNKFTWARGRWGQSINLKKTGQGSG